MACPLIEKLSGAINGFNVIFETSNSYVAGSVRVFVNGSVNEASGPDGWSELGTNRIAMKEPPRPTDIMQAYYIPR
jgi:hypothetical protein